jgi:hypothetical protein
MRWDSLPFTYYIQTTACRNKLPLNGLPSLQTNSIALPADSILACVPESTEALRATGKPLRKANPGFHSFQKPARSQPEPVNLPELLV